jgi:DNA-binding NarL/FixJ family response regulator
VGRKPRSEDPYADINRRLDMLIAIQLASTGFEKKEIAKILGISEKTIQRMFAGKWKKIQASNNERLIDNNIG